MVFQKTAAILAEILDIDDEEINPETRLTIDNGITALNIAKLVIECEKEFKITIHDEDVQYFKCINDIAEYIEKILAD